MTTTASHAKTLKKEKSFIELKDLPLEELFRGSVSSQSIISKTQLQRVSDDDKRDIIVVKKAFTLLDTKRRMVGVFSRSEKDHTSKVGQCSTLLCGNFDVTSCHITPAGEMIYDSRVRLHEHMGELSNCFDNSKSKAVSIVYFHDEDASKRYIYIIFELCCHAIQLPLYRKLKSRKGDLFLGLRHVGDIKSALSRFNKSPFHVDNKLVETLSSSGTRWPILSSKFSVAEKLVEVKGASFTLVKFQLIGF